MKIPSRLILLSVAAACSILITCCTKKKEAPELTTRTVTIVNDSTATSGGIINSDGNLLITEKGVQWSVDSTLANNDNLRFTTDGDSSTDYTSSIDGIFRYVKYFVRAYATNSKGTGYGQTIVYRNPKTPAVKNFNTSKTYGTLTDQDGNSYKTIVIGTQTWMAEDLITTKFNDGTAISLRKSTSDWANMQTPGYCWFANESPYYRSTFGALYNFHAVNTGKLCPTGWHVPTHAELGILAAYVGAEGGGLLKEDGYTHWLRPNKGGTNSTGFTALPDGYRSNEGAFSIIGEEYLLWSATETDAENAYSWTLGNRFNTFTSINGSKNFGFSVRCIKN